MNKSRDLRQITIDAIDAFCKRHGMSVRAFGAEHMSDPFFVYRLKKGSTDCRLSTIQKAWDACTK